MSAPLKLSELVAARKTMTTTNDVEVAIPALATVAKAADVLIEIAQAALQYRDAPEGDAAEEQWYVLRDLLAKVKP